MLAILTSSDDGKVILHMPYDATIVARLKMVIPSTYRTWDASRKVWTVEPAYADTLKTLLRSAGATVDDKRRGGSRVTSTLPWQAQHAYETLWVLPGAPEAVVSAAYKALAMRHHPDKGGDTRTMQRLNDAMTTIKGLQRPSKPWN